MRYRTLGRSGLLVSELALGAMTFGTGGLWGQIGGLDLDAARPLVDRALLSGVNLFDTADYYATGQSEEILAGALKLSGVDREDIVFATKARLRMGEGANRVGCSRKHLIAACDASLARTGLDYFDLYQLHGQDPLTPIEETLRALDDLTRQGKIRYVGFSNLPAWEVVKAQSLVDAKGYEKFVAMQAYYNPLCRDVETDLVPMANDQGIGLLVWSPLAGGLLSGKYQNGQTGRRSAFPFPPVREEALEAYLAAVEEIARSYGKTAAQVSIAWILKQSSVSSVLLGARTEAQLGELLDAQGWDLEQEDVERLDALAPPLPVFPHWMIERQAADRMPGSKPGAIALKRKAG